MNYDRRYEEGRGGMVPYSALQAIEGKLDQLLERVNKAATREEMTSLSKDLMQRFDTMEQRFVPRDVYEAEKKLAAAQVETLRAETANQFTRLSSDLSAQEQRQRESQHLALQPILNDLKELKERGKSLLNTWVGVACIIGGVAGGLSLLIGHLRFN